MGGGRAMLQRKRTIKSTDVMRDLRSGMNISQLTDKYNISLRALRLIFRKLLNAGVITKQDLNAQVALYRNTADLKGIRKSPRTSTSFPVRIYDSGNPFSTGYVLDISEKVVCVQGINAAVGEVKNFVVRSGASGQGPTFVFEGKCRWVATEQLSDNQFVAGFEIIDMSSLDSGELRKLIRHIGDQNLDSRISKTIQDTFDGID